MMKKKVSINRYNQNYILKSRAIFNLSSDKIRINIHDTYRLEISFFGKVKTTEKKISIY